MLSRRIILLITSGLVIIAIEGCSSYKTNASFTTIDSYSIEAMMKDPSSSMLPLKKGDSIGIYTNKKIRISSRLVSFISMDVTDIGPTKIKGKVVYVYGDVETTLGKEDLTGKIVEVNFEDIDEITVAKYEGNMRIKKIENENLNAGVEILGWLGALFIVLSIVF